MSNISRTILLSKNNISYIGRYDLESPLVSSIWIEINTNRNNKLLVCSYYRQWSLNSQLNIKNSNSIESQIDRYQSFCNQVERASCKGNDIIILSDDNINTLDDFSKTCYTNNFEIRQLHNKLIIDRSLTIHNSNPTFFRSGSNPS